MKACGEPVSKRAARQEVSEVNDGEIGNMASQARRGVTAVSTRPCRSVLWRLGSGVLNGNKGDGGFGGTRRNRRRIICRSHPWRMREVEW